MRKLHEEDYYSIVNIVIIVLFCLPITFATSCESQSKYVDLQYNKCESIELEYNSKVVTLALKNGWEPQSYEFNSTTLGDGFLNPYNDPNFKIFLDAYETYRVEWGNTLLEFNCNN